MDPLSRVLPFDSFPSALRVALPKAQADVLAWHATQGRHGLPWKSADPYAVWVSEVMLQQTQVATGLVRFPRWMARFPTIESLAAADTDAVMAEWEGLGYYARARNLHAAARRMVEHHAGNMPRARADRMALPGVGPSTASAIGAFAFGAREAIFDGNVGRVWSRWCGPLGPSASAAPAQALRWLWSWAQHATPQDPGAVGSWTQAVMDLGATVCTPRAPHCAQCPLAATCRGRATGHPEAWPLPRRKTVVREHRVDWGWWLRDGRVAMVRRPDGGIWSRLWVPPERGSSPPSPRRPHASGTHRLSHRLVRWTLEPSAAAPPADAVWLLRADWEARAWPRPLRVWWDGLTEAARAAWWDAGL